MTVEKFRERFENGENPTQLMNEMESAFGIPALNSPAYNMEHPDVIRLYREISFSRNFDLEL